MEGVLGGRGSLGGRETKGKFIIKSTHSPIQVTALFGRMHYQTLLNDEVHYGAILSDQY